MSETTSSNGMYGEPWRGETHDLGNITVVELLDANGKMVADAFRGAPYDEAERLLQRAAACVNALESVPDPAKFVEVFGQMRNALESLMRHKRIVDRIPSESDELHDELIAALAAAKEVCGE